MSAPRYPSPYQINTRVWLTELSRALGRPATLDDIPDGRQEGAQGRVARTLAFRLSLDETLDCGEDTGTPVSEDYRVPFKFTGKLKKVTIDLTPEPLSAEDGFPVARRRRDRLRRRQISSTLAPWATTDARAASRVTRGAWRASARAR